MKKYRSIFVNYKKVYINDCVLSMLFGLKKREKIMNFRRPTSWPEKKIDFRIKIKSYVSILEVPFLVKNEERIWVFLRVVFVFFSFFEKTLLTGNEKSGNLNEIARISIMLLSDYIRNLKLIETPRRLLPQ